MCSKSYFCDYIIADTLQYNWWKSEQIEYTNLLRLSGWQ